MSTQARPIVGFTASTTLEPEDIPRLSSLQLRIEAVMSDGRWHTLASLSAECGGTEASCSARLRQMRGRGWIVARQRKSRGLFLYAAKRRDPEQLGLL